MEEEVFLSGELEVVPAGKSRESGLDASMIWRMDRMTVSALIPLWWQC